MNGKHTDQPFYLNRKTFAILSILLSIGFAYVAWYLYRQSDKPNDEILFKLGEFALQIAIFVLIGAAVKEIVEWRTAEKGRYLKDAEMRADFLKRLRDMHIKILQSRDLMLAHQSAKTWAEESRNLMQVIPELEEISEELKVYTNLFEEQEQIEEGVEGIITYLKNCREEYMSNHEAVGSDWKATGRLDDTINKRGMVWYRDFTSGTDKYEADYIRNLKRAKLRMRSQVYGEKGDYQRHEPERTEARS
jgi:hypothetical protein